MYDDHGALLSFPTRRSSDLWNPNCVPGSPWKTPCWLVPTSRVKTPVCRWRSEEEMSELESGEDVVWGLSTNRVTALMKCALESPSKVAPGISTVALLVFVWV